MSDLRPDAFMLSLISVDGRAELPLYRQIYEGIRRAVLKRQLLPGTRLPSSRELAELLDVSRNTVVNAYEQLLAEGYLETRVGAGTFVNSSLPEEYLHVERPGRVAPAANGARTLSRLGQVFADQALPSTLPPHFPAFAVSLPDLAAFPQRLWARLARRHYGKIELTALDYQRYPAGYPPLREAIAAHLLTTRGVRCSAEQIVIVSGSQQALYLAGQALLDPGETVWMEDPGYPGAKRALQACGARIAPVPIDEQGLVVRRGQAEHPQARAAFITPSHQFPLGYTMSLSRRLELLQWAAANGTWIIEDDYDSEYRYGGRPIVALQGLDTQGRVIYAGTFSKTLFPQLRLGYLVAPADLVGAFTAARFASNLAPPLLSQMALADFIAEGHFVRHLRRMRRRYQARRDSLLEALQSRLPRLLSPGPAYGGLNLTAWLEEGIDDMALFRRAADYRLSLMPLSWMYAREPARHGLLLGFAAPAPEEIAAGARRLQALIESALNIAD